MNRIHPVQLTALAREVERLSNAGGGLWAQTPYLHDGALCAALWDGPETNARVVRHVGVTPYGVAVDGADVVAVHAGLSDLMCAEDRVLG